MVTAERRPQDIQKTPISISTVSGTEIRDRSLGTIGDVLAQTPAVVIQNSTKGETVYIRGVGSTGDAQEGGDPAVNLNIDGVYQQQAVVALANTFDIQRVEVLRGPQGTLYGRNANAGSINIITNDPSLAGYSGYASAGVGNYNAFRTEAVANVPFSGDLAGRVAFASSRHDGYLSNGASGQDSMAGRLKLLYQPTDALKLKLTADYAHDDGTPTATVPAPLDTEHPWNSVVPVGVQNVAVAHVYGQADYDLGFGTLTFLPAYSYTSQYQDSQLIAPPAGAAAQDVTERAESAELRLASNTSAQIQWVGGLYYYRADDKPLQDPAVTIDAPHNEITAANLPSDVLQDSKARSYAAYGQFTAPLWTPSLRLTGGARYTWDNKGYDELTQIGAPTYTDTTTGKESSPGAYTDGPSYSHSWGSFTYKAGLEYDVATNSMLYAKIGDGFKAGGFNNDGTVYAPEKIVAYEVGSKNRFFDQRLQLNASGFYYDYNGYQARLPYPDPTVAGGYAQKIQNAASVRIYGAELEGTMLVTAHDRFSASASYLHARYGTFVYSDTTGVHDRSDEVLPNAPTWSGLVSYVHTWDLNAGASLAARADMRYSSWYDSSIDQLLDSSGHDLGYDIQPAFTRTDATLIYTAADGKWNTRAYVRNIEDHAQRLLALMPAQPLAAIEVSDPRTFGLAFSVNL